MLNQHLQVLEVWELETDLPATSTAMCFRIKPSFVGTVYIYILSDLGFRQTFGVFLEGFPTCKPNIVCGHLPDANKRTPCIASKEMSTQNHNSKHHSKMRHC